jgi:hypothetical protein
MGFIGQTWRLYREQELLGQLVVTDADFPWLTPLTTTSTHGKQPMPAYGTR